MSNPEKTYSGQQSYHEMLVRAQALSPALTFVLCTFLTKIPIDPKKLRVGISIKADNEFFNLFAQNPDSCPMARFVKEVFHNFTVTFGMTGQMGMEYGMGADVQFVQWLQGEEVVVIDQKKRLVTIKM